MKNYLLSLTFIIAASTSFALDASLSYATFKSPQGNYIEIYLHIIGQSVSFIPQADSTQQKAELEVTILFEQNSQIIKFDKYLLSSPLAARPIDFIDLKRYGLENGTYQLKVKIQDQNTPENQKEYTKELSVEYGNSPLQQSDIQLLASYNKADSESPFNKSGFYLEPLPYNFYGRRASVLSFYNEIYGSDQAIGVDFMVSYSIEKIENQKGNLVMIRHKRQSPHPVNPILMQFDISKLESGNYNLIVEVRDRTKQLLSKKSVFFQRSNPFLEKEKIELVDVNLEEEFVKKLTLKQLEYSLRALTPNLPQSDVEVVNTMLKEKNEEGLRLYLFSFWTKENPTNPEFSYQRYMEVAAAIDKEFKSGFRYGFETDRGYTYMKYGQPNDITRKEEEPSAPPYEIWSYNEFPRTNQNNVRFIFYNPSLAPGDFVLLHSTATGEINNPQWQLELYRDAPSEMNGNRMDAIDMIDNFNRSADRYFRDF